LASASVHLWRTHRCRLCGTTYAGYEAVASSRDVHHASYRSIASILKTGLDKAFLPDTTPDADPIQHGNIRCRGYYH